MKSVILLFYIAFASLAAGGDLLSGSGDATFYYDVNGGGTCGPANGIASFPSVKGYALCETNSRNPKPLIDYHTNNIVAIPSALLSSNLDSYCGKKIVVTVNGVERDDLNLVVWDGCVSCNKNDGLDLSSTVFAELFGKDKCAQGNVKNVSWKIVDEQIIPYGDQESYYEQNNEENTHVEVEVDVGNNEGYVSPQPPVQAEEEQYSYGEKPVVACPYCEEEQDIVYYPPPQEEEQPVTVYYPTTQEEEKPITIYYPTTQEEEKPIIIYYPTTQEEEKPISIYYPTHQEEEQPVAVYYPTHQEEEKPITIYYPTTQEEEKPIIIYYPTTQEEEEQPVTVYYPSTQGEAPIYYPTTQEEEKPIIIYYPTYQEEEQPITVYYPSTQGEAPIYYPSTQGKAPIYYPTAQEEEHVVTVYAPPHQEEEVSYNPTVLYPLELEQKN